MKSFGNNAEDSPEKCLGGRFSVSLQLFLCFLDKVKLAGIAQLTDIPHISVCPLREPKLSKINALLKTLI